VDRSRPVRRPAVTHETVGRHVSPGARPGDGPALARRNGLDQCLRVALVGLLLIPLEEVLDAPQGGRLSATVDDRDLGGQPGKRVADRVAREVRASAPDPGEGDRVQMLPGDAVRFVKPGVVAVPGLVEPHRHIRGEDQRRRGTFRRVEPGREPCPALGVLLRHPDREGKIEPCGTQGRARHLDVGRVEPEGEPAQAALDAEVPGVGDRHLGGAPALSDLQDHRPGVSRQFPLQLHGSPEEGPAPGEEAGAGRGERLVERTDKYDLPLPRW